MRRRRAREILIAGQLAAAVLAASPARAKIGLAARFGDVILENAKLGQTYNLREAARVPFGVENRSDTELEVLVEFGRPREAALSAGYEPAPDLSWFKASPDRLRLPQKSLGFFDLLMTVPDDPKLVGRHFQVMVKVRSADGSGGQVGVGIENRMRVSIGPGPETLKEEKKRKVMQQLDFDVTPRSLYLTGIEPGKTYDSRKDAKKSLRVANYASDELAVKLGIEEWDRRIPLPEGYTPIPDLSWLEVRPATVTVAGEDIGLASIAVRVPDKPEHRGKRWLAMVRTGLTTGFWLDAAVKVFVETAP